MVLFLSICDMYLQYGIFDANALKRNAPLQMIILYWAWENRQKNVLVMYLGMMQLLTQKSIHHRFKYVFQNTTFVLGLGKRKDETQGARHVTYSAHN